MTEYKILHTVPEKKQNCKGSHVSYEKPAGLMRRFMYSLPRSQF